MEKSTTVSGGFFVQVDTKLVIYVHSYSCLSEYDCDGKSPLEAQEKQVLLFMFDIEL